jgi:CBS domain-containing protein
MIVPSNARQNSNGTISASCGCTFVHSFATALSALTTSASAKFVRQTADPREQRRFDTEAGRALAILECKMVASASAASTRKYRREAMNVESILRLKGTEVTTIAPEATVKRAADWLRAKNIGSVVVTSGNSILGVISEREIVHALSQFGEQVASMTVKDIMRHGLVTVAPEDDLSRVMKLMTRHRVRHMPVLRDGKLCGIISIGDVVKHRLDDLELEANILRDAYIAHH